MHQLQLYPTYTKSSQICDPKVINRPSTVFEILSPSLPQIYTKPPECVDIICRTSRGFHRWCLEARVRRTSAFRAPAGKTE